MKSIPKTDESRVDEMIRRADSFAHGIMRNLFFALLIRPAVRILLGPKVKYRERLPDSGPAIVIANHNSHLDTALLASLFPRRLLPRIRPVAAADYFLKNKLIAWFSLRIVGIIPLKRRPKAGDGDPFAECDAALRDGGILILFPEGSRGEPEQLEKFKSGLAHLAKRNPKVPVFPLYLYGTGKALPRGDFMLVPFNCDVIVGDPVLWSGDRDKFMGTITERVVSLAAEGDFPPWE